MGASHAGFLPSFCLWFLFRAWAGLDSVVWLLFGWKLNRICGVEFCSIFFIMLAG
jgi:hypothetical protein